MAFVHSLVRVDDKGWIAPMELGDKAPAYVSFVVPLSEQTQLRDEYACQLAYTGNVKSKNRKTVNMYAKSKSTLLCEIDGVELWFRVAPMAKARQRIPYIGSLIHEDFAFSLVEIEPRDFALLDELCDKHGIFIIGCDPQIHYRSTKT